MKPGTGDREPQWLRRIVLASGNAGKLAELRALLADTGIELIPQREFDVTDADETGTTFVENAIIKARHAAGVTGLPALADDSGICVDALEGAPGLDSAIYAGTHGEDEANNARLLHELSGVADPQRTAHYTCLLVLLRTAADPDPMITIGRWPGRVLTASRGTHGFGYDPLFVPDDAGGPTAAELDPSVKNRISHRGRAVRLLRHQLETGDRGLETQEY